MSEGYILLLLVLSLGLISGNALIAGAALCLVLLKAAEFHDLFPWILRYGFNLGLFFMVLTILTPIADERISVSRFAGELLSRTGLFTVAVSAVLSVVARWGVNSLNLRPDLLVGLLVGGVLGVIFLGGVPTGPLIPAGVIAVLIHLLR